MKKQRLIMAALAGTFALCMSLPFLLPNCGFLALFGLVPLLCLNRMGTQLGMKQLWLWEFSTFIAWNALTTFWVCNATIGGGIFAIVMNALQMTLIFRIFQWSKKIFRGPLAYTFLVVMWIAWEKAYLGAQISWPWLVLGNSLARDVMMIQWYEYTGSLGGSLWIWATNLSLFGLIVSLSDGSFYYYNRKAKVAASVGYLTLLIAPIILSINIYNNYSNAKIANTSTNTVISSETTIDNNELEVLVVQPNFDPYHKFEYYTQQEQNTILLNQIKEAIPDRRINVEEIKNHCLSDNKNNPLLVLAPETFTNDVISNRIQDSKTFMRFGNFLERYPNTNILFGASSYEIIPWNSPTNPPTPTARHYYENLWLESHNSAIITDATRRGEIFHKSKLVVGVELMPYPKFFRKIDDMLGGVMGHCTGQDEISLLNVHSYDSLGKVKENIPIGSIICYESVYGEYCTGYVKAGAKALAIITNDAWWGNTPGYMQHLSYASLRAIELRRDIARCANTGISGFINSRGDIRNTSDWWEQQTLRDKIQLNSKITFFVKHGDIVGRFSTFIFILMLLALVVQGFIPKAVRKI